MTDLPSTAPYGETGVAFAFEAFGRHLALYLCDAALLEPVAAILPLGWRPAALSDADRHVRVEWLTATNSGVYREGFHLYDGDEFKRWAPDRAMAVDGIETEIEHDIAEFAEPWLFMHAGVVAWHGEAIVLPGASHAGKSTLTAALVEAGATYYSDEYAVLNAEGRVLPFPRRLSLRDGPLGPTGRLNLRHRTAQQDKLMHPVPIGRVYMLRYQPDRDFRIDPLPPGSAIMELCQHMVAIQRRPQDVLATLNALTRTAPVFSGERGDAREAARWILHTNAVQPSGIHERAHSCK